ncbi:hypothetical protein GNZ12_06745 [Paraburkholderia sp. 1N]|uniref:Uncharacterized protein n=1 Tax=Paraburkholderia solitsugae TaxID=2675748 RepID=A0ABX2BLP4_9BURK|nr:hypothetical protein [Paraburkholderia solitsugae]NPT41020.1 hypothetical protein [Paraburkholderia solitsugae]
MKSEDSQFVRDVVDALRNVRHANVVRASHSITFGDEKPVEASVTLTRKDIRERTGRQRVRAPVLVQLATEFGSQHGVEASLVENEELRVQTVPVETESAFSSVEQLLSASKSSTRFLGEYEEPENNR